MNQGEIAKLRIEEAKQKRLPYLDLSYLGLSLAFFYSTPDNSLGILWNDKNPYELNGIKKEL